MLTVTLFILITFFSQPAAITPPKSPETQPEKQQETGRSANVTKQGRVTVTGTRIKQATLPAAVIKSLKSDKRFTPFVTIEGSSMTAAKGYMLLKLRKSGIFLVINEDSAGSSSEGATVKLERSSRIVTRLGYGLLVEIRICGCGEDTDDCQFGRIGTTGVWDTDTCGGGSCCRLTCLRVDRYGNVFECESTQF